MKEFFSTLKKIAFKLLETELESKSGRINLIGGIILVILIGAVYIEDFVTKIFNLILAFFNKSYLPSLSGGLITVAIISVAIYFYLCVSTISKLKGKDW